MTNKRIGPKMIEAYEYIKTINALWLDKFGRYALTAEYIQEHA